MEWRAIIISAITSVVVVSILNNASSKDNRVSPNTLETRIDALQAEQKKTSDKVDSIDMSRSLENIAFVSSSSEGSYAPVHTNVGNLTITLQHIEKYADGYKVTLQIGNPLLARLDDLKVTLVWGEAWGQHVEYTINEPIYAGTWHTITKVISPASEKDIKSIGVILVPDKILLTRN